MKAKPFQVLVAVSTAALAANSTWAATVTKNNTYTMQADTTDWSAAPATTDVGSFTGTLDATHAAGLTLGGDLSIGALLFNNTLNGPVTIGSGGTLTLNNAGTGLDLTAANQDVTVNCDIAFGANQTWTVNAGKILTVTGNVTGTNDLMKAGAGTLVLSGANSGYTGSTTINAGTLALQNTYATSAFSIASGAVLELNVVSGSRDSATTSFSGTGTLVKSGSGEVIWGGGSATFSMGSGSLIDVQGGTFVGGSNANENWTSNLSALNVVSGAVFNGVEANVRVDALTGAGTIQSGFPGAGYANFTFGVNNGSGNFSGVLADAASAGSFVKTGTGTQTLSGPNTYTGTTTVNGGTLVIAGSVSASSPVSVNAGATLFLTGGNATGNSGGLTSGPWTINGGIVSADGVGGVDTTEVINGDLNLNAGTLTTSLSGFNSTYGNFFIYNDGTQVNVGGSAKSVISASVHMFGEHTYNVGVTGDPSGIDLLISGQIGNFEGGAWGFINKTGTGTMKISNSGNSIGGITVSDGKVLFQDSMSGMYNGGLLDNAAVETNISGAISTGFGYNIFGSGTFTKSGTGTLALSGANTYTGGTTVSGGTLQLDSSLAANSNLTVNTGATVDVNGTNLMFNGTNVTLDGGTLRFIGGLHNHFNGSLTLNGGTITTAGAGSFDNGNYQIDAATVTVGGSAASTIQADAGIQLGTTVNFAVADATGSSATDLTVSGAIRDEAYYHTSFGISKSGAGTLTLTADNTYTGNTTVNNGTLALVNGSQASPITVASGAKLGFTLGSPTTSTSSVTFVGATAKVTVTGTPAAATLMTASSITGTPVLDPAIPGYTLAIEDGGTTLKLKAGAIPDYTTWANSFLPGHDVSNPAGDNDHDGLTNFAEYAFGLSPISGSSVNPITSPLNKGTGQFSYTRRNPALATGVTFSYEYSANLASWNPLTPAATGSDSGSPTETVTVTVPSALLLANPTLFVRVLATQP